MPGCGTCGGANWIQGAHNTKTCYCRKAVEAVAGHAGSAVTGAVGAHFGHPHIGFVGGQIAKAGAHEAMMTESQIKYRNRNN